MYVTVGRLHNSSQLTKPIKVQKYASSLYRPKPRRIRRIVCSNMQNFHPFHVHGKLDWWSFDKEAIWLNLLNREDIAPCRWCCPGDIHRRRPTCSTWQDFFANPVVNWIVLVVKPLKGVKLNHSSIERLVVHCREVFTPLWPSRDIVRMTREVWLQFLKSHRQTTLDQLLLNLLYAYASSGHCLLSIYAVARDGLACHIVQRVHRKVKRNYGCWVRL
mmetsp:Transcript_10603/g.19624  ORF Transcript_10603/g.19624 Transcript_10603/m.19624 type:complete len:217 (+) Transcript_10603:242-892(+)